MIIAYSRWTVNTKNSTKRGIHIKEHTYKRSQKREKRLTSHSKYGKIIQNIQGRDNNVK